MTQNMDNKPKIRRESKNKIRVEFERTSLKERLKTKYLSMFFLKRAAWFLFRLLLLIGIVIKNPFLNCCQTGKEQHQTAGQLQRIEFYPKNFFQNKVPAQTTSQQNKKCRHRRPPGDVSDISGTQLRAVSSKKKYFTCGVYQRDKIKRIFNYFPKIV